MFRFLELLRDEAGVVTVEWVSLTAATLLLGTMAVTGIYNNGVSSLASSVDTTLSDVERR